MFIPKSPGRPSYSLGFFPTNGGNCSIDVQLNDDDGRMTDYSLDDVVDLIASALAAQGSVSGFKYEITTTDFPPTEEPTNASD